MNSKFTIDSTTDGGGKLHEAIAGGCIVDVLVNDIPINEADLSRASSRSVTLKMSSGTEVEFKSKVTDPYSGTVVEHDSRVSPSIFATGEIIGKRVIAAWVDYVTEDRYADGVCWNYKTLRVLVDGFHRPMTLINTEHDRREEGPLMLVEIRERSRK